MRKTGYSDRICRHYDVPYEARICPKCGEAHLACPKCDPAPICERCQAEAMRDVLVSARKSNSV